MSETSLQAEKALLGGDVSLVANVHYFRLKIQNIYEIITNTSIRKEETYDPDYFSESIRSLDLIHRVETPLR